MKAGEAITVLKLNLAGRVTWQYDGLVTQLLPDRVELVAHFNRPDMPFQGILIKQGDPFLESFFFERWYNIFAMHDRDDDALKGWYCNIAYPARLRKNSVSFVDLGLDLWVAADGRQEVLDEDEFAAMTLSDHDRAMARAALGELQADFSARFRK